MSNRDLKLIYMALGALMLILLQTNVFQNAISFIHLIPIPYLLEISFFFVNMLSFIGAILFIIIALKLIFNNIKN